MGKRFNLAVLFGFVVLATLGACKVVDIAPVYSETHNMWEVGFLPIKWLVLDSPIWYKALYFLAGGYLMWVYIVPHILTKSIYWGGKG